MYPISHDSEENKLYHVNLNYKKTDGQKKFDKTGPVEWTTQAVHTVINKHVNVT